MTATIIAFPDQGRPLAPAPAQPFARRNTFAVGDQVWCPARIQHGRIVAFSRDAGHGPRYLLIDFGEPNGGRWIHVSAVVPSWLGRLRPEGGAK